MPRPKQSPLIRLEITLTQSQSNRVEAISLSQYRTKTSVVNQALDEYFAKLDSGIK
jgi:hypothetical protein